MRWIMTFAIVSLLFAATHSPVVAVVDSTRSPLIENASSPKTDGTWITWVAADTDGGPRLYARNLVTGANVLMPALPPLAFTDDWYDLDDGVVAWTERGDCGYCVGVPGSMDILAMDLQTGQRFEVATTNNVEGTPAISNGRVVWYEWDDVRWRIFVREYRASERAQLVFEEGPNPAYHRLGPRFDGDRVAWYYTTYDESDRNLSWQILVRDLNSQHVDVAAQGTGMPGDYDMVGDLLTYTEYGVNVHIVDLKNGADYVVAKEGAWPITDGRYVFWRSQQRADPNLYNFRAYDTQTSATFLAVEHVGQYNRIDLAAGTVVWSRSLDPRNGIYSPSDVYVAGRSGVLPSADQTESWASDPALRFFPETSHYLTGPFEAYWQANGGLAVFGYPLTEEFKERNDDTDANFTVQYFERERFEWHPENVRTPYAVLLGRLGAELLEQQGRDWRAFPTADPAAPHYMPETGHAIEPRFLEFWSGHGIDLGDEGTSFQESLALFGFPLSEPMIETKADNDTVMTQYFERAVFEWHPDNPADYRVLLRRLGVAEMAARDW